MKPKAGSESNEIDNPFGQTDQDKNKAPYIARIRKKRRLLKQFHIH